jgi:hypothetical protein
MALSQLTNWEKDKKGPEPPFIPEPGDRYPTSSDKKSFRQYQFRNKATVARDAGVNPPKFWTQDAFDVVLDMKDRFKRVKDASGNKPNAHWTEVLGFKISESSGQAALANQATGSWGFLNQYHMYTFAEGMGMVIFSYHTRTGGFLPDLVGRLRPDLVENPPFLSPAGGFY